MKTAASHLPTSTLFRRTLCLLAVTLSLAQPARSEMLVGSGNVTSEPRKVSGFHALELNTFGNVVLTQGDTEELTIEGEDNLLPLVQSEVDAKGTLRLSFKEARVRATKPLTFKVSCKFLDNVVLAGSGNITGKSLAAKDGGSLNATLRGSGNIFFDTLTVGNLKVSLEGSGNFRLGGTAEQQTVSLLGSGDYDAGELKSKAATVTLAGSGDCEVWTTDELKADLSGSGDVSYYGKPGTVDKHVSGSGSVEALGVKGQ